MLNFLNNVDYGVKKLINKIFQEIILSSMYNTYQMEYVCSKWTYLTIVGLFLFFAEVSNSFPKLLKRELINDLISFPLYFQFLMPT